MTKKYLVFDLDGTLINSIPDMCREIGLFLQKQGERPLTEPETVSIIGNGARVMLAGALKLVGKETT
ncbi:MAG TPA: phosphoglycolate phosphatase, partial [Alphaproteobacteria bacterium]|nr:phosphoglycolate phosphatase [Alphaproteobacteria bacterium]